MATQIGYVFIPFDNFIPNVLKETIKGFKSKKASELIRRREDVNPTVENKPKERLEKKARFEVDNKRPLECPNSPITSMGSNSLFSCFSPIALTEETKTPPYMMEEKPKTP